MKKPPHPEPPPEPSGEPAKTLKHPDPLSEATVATQRLTKLGISKRTFRIAKLLIVLLAAIISAKLLEPDTHSIKFLEGGIIRSTSLRAERNGFKRSFVNGHTVFPAEKVERSYAVYDPVGGQFLGTLTVPDDSFTDPILIELEQPSGFWKPAPKSAGTTPTDGPSDRAFANPTEKPGCLPSSAGPILIEHHMAVAAEADWILDLGPEAGDSGGEIVAQGPPELVARSKKSRTAPFLASALRLR